MRACVRTLCIALALTGGSAIAGAMERTLSLNPVDASGQSGTATLIAQDDKTEVIIQLSGAPEDTTQPAHIHDGSCSNLGGPRWPLNAVSDGSSTTVVPVPLSILEQGSYAINVHQSADAMGTNVACGDIPRGPAIGGVSPGTD